MSLNFQAVLPDDSKNETKSMVQVTDEISGECPELESKEQSKIQIFKNEEFGRIRTLEIDGEPWFAATDIAKSLGYRMASDLIRRIDNDDKGTHLMSTPGGEQTISIINESGLYSAILGSKLESAKRFKHWVTSEVLPSIRKHGAYATETTIDKIINDPDFGIRFSAWLQREKRAAVPPSNKRFITVNHKLM